MPETLVVPARTEERYVKQLQELGFVHVTGLKKSFSIPQGRREEKIQRAIEKLRCCWGRENDVMILVLESGETWIAHYDTIRPVDPNLAVLMSKLCPHYNANIFWLKDDSISTLELLSRMKNPYFQFED